MTSLDEKILPKIASMIDTFGILATFTVPGDQDYHAADGVVDAGPVTSIVAKVSPPNATKVEWEGGDQVINTQTECYVAGQGLTFVPVPGMIVATADDEWVITKVEPLRSGDSVAAFRLVLVDR